MRRIPMLPLALALIALLLGTALGNVVINEVELNPAGAEGAHKSPAQAWVELCDFLPAPKGAGLPVS